MSVAKQRSVLVLICIFSIHNYEEIYHLPREIEKLPLWVKEKGPWSDTKSFALATGILTATVSTSFYLGVNTLNKDNRIIFLSLPSAALVGNSLSHIMRAIVQYRYNGGLITAPVMGLLAAKVFFSSTKKMNGTCRRQLFLKGNLVAIPAIISSLYIGRFLARYL